MPSRWRVPRCGSCARPGRSLPEYRAPPRGGAASSTPSPIPSSPPSSRCSRSAATASTPPSSSATSWCPSHAVGFGVEVEQGRGPVVDRPFRSARRPGPAAPARARDRHRLRARGDPPGHPRAGRPRIPLIGFAGAPFTVASYLIEGGPSATFAKTKALMHGDPALWARLLDRLADMALASLRAQVEAGAPGGPALRQLGRGALPRRLRAVRPARHARGLRRARPTSGCPASTSAWAPVSCSA